MQGKIGLHCRETRPAIAAPRVSPGPAHLVELQGRGFPWPGPFGGAARPGFPWPSQCGGAARPGFPWPGPFGGAARNCNGLHRPRPRNDCPARPRTVPAPPHHKDTASAPRARKAATPKCIGQWPQFATRPPPKHVTHRHTDTQTHRHTWRPGADFSLALWQTRDSTTHVFAIPLGQEISSRWGARHTGTPGTRRGS